MEEVNLKAMLNIGFVNSSGVDDETQIDVDVKDDIRAVIDIINMVLELKDEMDIKAVTYIELEGYTSDVE